MDQPIGATTNPHFREMIEIASRATDGVEIPGRKAVRATILRLFKRNLLKLKAHLNVSIPVRHLLCLRRISADLRSAGKKSWELG
ncbi:hypothetical protein B0H14DRAFT_3431111 [Mycena olivaceomarginata]|nr:hypothetical protein B0H14DRAFT_3431111 [Mycena olivaceomarginata]